MHGRSDVKAVVLGLKNLRLTTSLPIVSLLSTTTSRVMLLLVKMIYIYCSIQKDLERFREGREIGRLGEERGGGKGWTESFQNYFFDPGEKGD